MDVYYTFFYYVPATHLEGSKQAIFAAGAGKLDNYNCCSWETQGIGQYRPEIGSNAYAGKIGEITQAIEYKVETICSEELLPAVIQALKAAHPYEVPAYGVIKMENK